MNKLKNKEQELPKKREDKMVKPKQGVRPFNFPAHNVTIHATDIRDAENQLENLLKSKSKKDD